MKISRCKCFEKIFCGCCVDHFEFFWKISSNTINVLLCLLDIFFPVYQLLFDQKSKTIREFFFLYRILHLVVVLRKSFFDCPYHFLNNVESPGIFRCKITVSVIFDFVVVSWIFYWILIILIISGHGPIIKTFYCFFFFELYSYFNLGFTWTIFWLKNAQQFDKK